LDWSEAAICALSPSSENSYLAYPSPLVSPNSPFSSPPAAAPVSSSQARAGDVLLFDALSLSVTNIIQAHKTPLSFVTLNQAGTTIATASDKGTVIRVFSVPNGDKIAQFRRGTYPAKIYNMTFNAVSTLLAVASDTETIHIFKLPSKDRDLPASNVVRRSVHRSLSSEDDSASNSGYEALIDQKRNATGVGCASHVRQRGRWHGLKQEQHTEEVPHARPDVRWLNGRLLAEYAHRDVGAAAGFRIPQAADLGRAFRRRHVKASSEPFAAS
jgi:WD40 repeat protein